MKMIPILFLLFAGSITCTSCEKEEFPITSGNLQIEVVAGENWLHDYPLFLGLSKENPPQFAIWIEDTLENYVTTVYVTKKIATEGWVSNKGNRRKEALPYWCHQRGVVYRDGLMLPTKENPMPDAVTGATPKSSRTFATQTDRLKAPFVIKAEFNHSVDFNKSFPKNAKKGDGNYSGGSEGSGQPAIIYAGTIYPNQTTIELKLIGRSSADGSDGNIYTDLEKLTTARNIVQSITCQIVEKSSLAH